MPFPRWVIWALALGCLTLTACANRDRRHARPVPLPPGVSPDAIRDVPGCPEADRTPNGELAVHQFRAEQRRAAEPSAPQPGAGRDYLVLSGLGSRSLYTYGVVCGWADSGAMPEFAVITGVGGGAYAAVTAFAGRDSLADLRRIFLSIDQRQIQHGDAWDVKRFPHPFGIGTASVASTDKIHALTHPVFDDAFFAKVAAEHARGRRLYVGTTNLDTQRFVIWDMGAIASAGTPESRKLFEDLVVASTCMPPLLEPERIAVTVDGRRYEEMHVDGGLTRSLFFYPPSDWPGDEADRRTGDRMLAGGRVHVVLGDKVYNDPEGTKTTLADVSLRGWKAVMFALHRADLARLYAHCLDRDMAVRVAAIPPEFDPPLFPTDEFNPAKTRRLFCEGYTRAQDGRAWDDRPPERAVSEERARRGTVLTAADTAGPPAPVPPPAR